MSSDYDVIVVGAGGAGLAAALSAAESGAKTLLVDAAERVGGSTALSGGVLYAAGTAVQRAAGITDTTADMYRHYMNLNQYRLHPGLIRRLCDDSPATVEWLMSCGVEFLPDRLYASGPDGVRRGHRAVGRGEVIVASLEARVLAHDRITLAVRTRVTALRQEAGRLSGIVAADTSVSAAAVVLCCGGFGANFEMISEYLPDTARYRDWLWYVGSPYCRGEGIEMAQTAGADSTGLHSVTTLLTPGFGRDFEPYVPGWFMFVSRDGRRFVDETIDYSVSGGIVRELPGGECFAIFDEAARSGQQVKRSKGGETLTTPSWSPERLAQGAASGEITKADSLGQLAAAVGINADRLAATVRGYNRDCDAGADTAFFKSAELLRPISSPPYYAVRIRPAVVGITGFGVLVDPEAAVIGMDGNPIAGLYAAGETVGGWLGSCYAAGGASLTNAFGYGRRAGESGARFALGRAVRATS